MIERPPLRHFEEGLSGRDIARLRWAWLAAQAAAATLGHLGFGLEVPYAGVAAVLLTGLAVNSVATRRPSVVAVPLVLDVALLGALLVMSGGLANPFAVLLSAPAFVGALSTAPRAARPVAAAVLIVTTLLALTNDPIGPAAWLAVNTMAGLAAVVGHVLQNASGDRGEMAAAIALERSADATGIAFAAAAHEMATPLSTIRVAAADLVRELEDGSAAHADALLIEREALRCGAIIEAARGSGASATAMPVTQIVAQAAAPHRERGIEIRIHSSGDGVEPRIDHSEAAILGIRNIIQNAVDFARSEVTVRVVWTSETAEVTVSDDGDGFDRAILADTQPGPDRPRPRGGPGSGNGLALARALLARGGAVVELGSASPEGALVRVTWLLPARHG